VHTQSTKEPISYQQVGINSRGDQWPSKLVHHSSYISTTNYFVKLLVDRRR